MVVHVCNPNYTAGRGRRIMSSFAIQTKLVRPYLKNKIQTKGLGAWLKWERSPQLYPQYCKREKKKRTHTHNYQNNYLKNLTQKMKMEI
jgi:hypothetical protein